MQTYGPGDEWPDHQQQWWQDVFQRARGMGWSLKKTSHHPRYYLACPGGSDECQILAYSTGRGSESACKTEAKKLTRCKHGSRDPEQEIEKALDSADRLLRAADSLCEAYDSGERAEQLMDSSGRDEDIAELLTSMDDLLRQAEQELSTLPDIEADIQDPQRSAGELLGIASTRVRSAREELASRPRSSTRKKLMERCRALRADCDRLSTRLKSR